LSCDATGLPFGPDDIPQHVLDPVDYIAIRDFFLGPDLDKWRTIQPVMKIVKSPALLPFEELVAEPRWFSTDLSVLHDFQRDIEPVKIVAAGAFPRAALKVGHEIVLYKHIEHDASVACGQHSFRAFRVLITESELKSWK
jgi:hypothetical protein